MPSPERSGKPGGQASPFSWSKRATKGSSFLSLEKCLPERGLEAECWKMLLKK